MQGFFCKEIRKNKEFFKTGRIIPPEEYSMSGRDSFCDDMETF